MKAMLEMSDVERRVREMYGRVAAAWAMDMLELRRSGRDKPGFRPQRRLLVTPSFGWEHRRGEAA